MPDVKKKAASMGSQKTQQSLQRKLIIAACIMCGTALVYLVLHIVFVMIHHVQGSSCPYSASDMGLNESMHFFTFSQLDDLIFNGMTSSWSGMRASLMQNPTLQSIALLAPVLAISVMGIAISFGLTHLTLKDIARMLAMIIAPSWILFTSSGNQMIDMLTNFFTYTSTNRGIIGSIVGMGNTALLAASADISLGPSVDAALNTISANSDPSNPYYMMDLVPHIIFSQTIFWKLYAMPFILFVAPALLYIFYILILMLMKIFIAIVFAKITIFASLQLLPIFAIFIPIEELANIGKSPDKRSKKFIQNILMTGIVHPTIYLILLLIFLGIMIKIFILIPLVTIFNFQVCGYNILGLPSSTFTMIPFLEPILNLNDYHVVPDWKSILPTSLLYVITLLFGVFTMPKFVSEIEQIAQMMSNISGSALGKAISGKNNDIFASDDDGGIGGSVAHDASKVTDAIVKKAGDGGKAKAIAGLLKGSPLDALKGIMSEKDDEKTKTDSSSEKQSPSDKFDAAAKDKEERENKERRDANNVGEKSSRPKEPASSGDDPLSNLIS